MTNLDLKLRRGPPDIAPLTPFRVAGSAESPAIGSQHDAGPRMTALGGPVGSGVPALQVQSCGQGPAWHASAVGDATAEIPSCLHSMETGGSQIEVAGIKAPILSRRVLLGSGLLSLAGFGPAPPPGGTYLVPHTLELWDHSNEASPTLAGTMTFTGASTSMAFDDPHLNAELGTIPVRHATTLAWGGFDWGAHRYALPGGVNDTSPGLAFHQVLVYNKPNTNWTNYPSAAGFNKDTSNTFSPAFKIVMKDPSGKLIHTFQMHDGLPINSWQLNVGAQHSGIGKFTDSKVDGSKPIREHWNCAMALPWTQARTKRNAKARWWFAGVVPRVLRGSMAAKSFTTTAPYLPWGFGSQGRAQGNGMRNYRYMPLRPRAMNTPIGTDPHLDPFMAQWWLLYPNQTLGAIGYGYDPGNTGVFEAYCGPGGVRFDRGGWPSPLVEVLTDPNHVHAGTNTPSTTVLDHSALNAFNLSLHFTGNVATGAPALGPTQTFNTGPRGTSTTAWGHVTQYYYGGPLVLGGLAQCIDVRAVPNGSGDSGPTEEAKIAAAMRFYRRDPATNRIRRVWNGHCFDEQHSHQFMGGFAGFFNSPMHAWHALHALQMNSMATNRHSEHVCDFGKFPPGWWKPAWPLYDNAITRAQAYKLMHLTTCWWLANNHPHFGMSRADLESEIVRYLKTYYTKIYVPKWAPASDSSPYWVGTRRFGMGVSAHLGSMFRDGQYYMWLDGSPAGCYMIVPLMLAAQCGLLERLMTLGDAQITTALTDLVATLDKLAVDGTVDAGFVYTLQDSSYRVSNIYSSFEDLTVANLATSWAHLASTVNPAPGSASYLKGPDGNWKPGVSNWAHVLAMYVFGAHHYLRSYFPNPRSQEAVDFIDRTHAAHTAYVQAGATKLEQNNRDWTYLVPATGMPAAPMR